MCKFRDLRADEIECRVQSVKENGLVHVSQLANRFVSDPTTIVSVHQHVTVRVLEVDYARKRISLSMKEV